MKFLRGPYKFKASELIRPSYFLLFGPPMLVTSVQTNSDGSWDSIWSWALANAFAIALLLIFFQLLKKVLIEKHDFSLGLLALTFLGAGIGYAKGWLTFVLGAQIVGLDPLPILGLEKSVTSMLIGVMSFFTLALAVKFVQDYEVRRKRLLGAQVEIYLNPKFRKRQFDSIAKRIAAIETTLANQKELTLASKELKKLALSTVRPLSHGVWIEAAERLRSLNVIGLIRTAIETTPFAPLGFAVICFVGVGVSTAHFRFDQSFPLTIATVLASTLPQFLGGFFIATNLIQAIFRFLMVNLVAGIFAAFAYSALSPIPVESFVLLAASLFVWFSEIGIFVAISKAAIEASLALELVSRTKPKTTQPKEISPSDKLAARELAQQLHSDVQNKLLASAMQLESKSASANHVMLELAAIRQTLSSMQRLERKDFPLINVLKGLQTQWGGFLQVNFDLGNLPNSFQVRPTVTLALNEIVLNSKRHGKSTELNLVFELIQNKQTLKIIATDNGVGSGRTAKGLGSDLFDELTLGNWSRTYSSDAGTTVELLCPVRDE